MAWRMRYLTTRDHPLAFAAYAATFLLGLTLLTGWVDTVSLSGIDQAIAILWKAQLLTGGLGALWAIIQTPKMTPHWPDLGDLLRMEGIAAGQAGLGFFVYTYNVIHFQHAVSIGAVVLGVMGLGMMARCWQAYRESSQAERLALLYDEVKHTLEDLEQAQYPGPVDLPEITRLDAETIQVQPVRDHEPHGESETDDDT
jgi:hypothetical protein